MMIRRSSGPRNRRRTAPTTPGQNLCICRYRTRSHESAAPPPTHVASTRGCNGTDTPTLRIIAPTSPPARLISARSRRPTTTRRRRCASISSAPMRLQAGAARGRHHDGLPVTSMVTSDLREMTATRPVTTQNLHCAPHCAKPADHHDTPPHQRRAFQFLWAPLWLAQFSPK